MEVITREDLEAKRAELEQQMRKLQSDADAVHGAMQLVDQQLALLDQKKAKKKP